jgi:streptogramin lyase
MQLLNDLAIGRGALWLVGLREVYRFDTDQKTVVAAIPLPGAGAVGRAVTVGEGGIWVAYWGRSGGPSLGVLRIDPDSSRVVADIVVRRQVFEWPSAVLYVSDGMVWVASTTGQRPDLQIARIDPRINQAHVVASPGGALRAPLVGHGSLWALRGPFDLVRVSLETMQPLATISVDPNPTPAAIGTDAVWLISQSASALLRIEPKTNRVVNRLTIARRLGACREPVVTEHDVWLTCTEDASASGGWLARMDPRTGEMRVVTESWPFPAKPVVGEGAVWYIFGQRSGRQSQWFLHWIGAPREKQ